MSSYIASKQIPNQDYVNDTAPLHLSCSPPLSSLPPPFPLFSPSLPPSSSMVGQIGRHVSVFTFGYGGEHDADLLRGVSEAGSGLFYYIDNADSIPESFCDCLGGLLSVAAQV